MKAVFQEFKDLKLYTKKKKQQQKIIYTYTHIHLIQGLKKLQGFKVGIIIIL